MWVSGHFHWVPDGWQVQRDYFENALITHVQLFHPDLQLKIIAHDWVDIYEDVYFKKWTVENLSNEKREVRVFLSHDFHLYGTDIGDTAEYRPENKTLLHYKAKRYFLLNLEAKGIVGIEHYATGNKALGLFEGTWKDAEDGNLSGNPIAQGSVDSVMGAYLFLPPKGKESCYNWIACGKTWQEVKELNALVKKKGAEFFFARTKNYWNLWVNQSPIDTTSLPQDIARQYKRSLSLVRSQMSDLGSIMASNDSDTIQFNRDTYSYMWPRDGALAAYALDLAGYPSTIDFYNFCNRILEKEGYFLHKYTPSGSLASSWHPWIENHEAQLPIQEDGTALVIWALWKHYEKFKDIDSIGLLYRSLVKPAADFMMNYRDPKTGLPLPSYDLWEERHGVLTFTTSAVYGGLTAAAEFARCFGESELAQEYFQGASRMRAGMDQYLYLEKEKRFARMVCFANDKVEVDSVIDASLYGVFAFGAYSPHDEKVKNTMEQIHKVLWNPTGGVIRYENDSYYRKGERSNPWMITTLWLAQYYIAIAKEKQDLAPAIEILQWVAASALESGVLPEQVDPITFEPLSVAPLTWSHAAYIATVQQLLNQHYTETT